MEEDTDTIIVSFATVLQAALAKRKCDGMRFYGREVRVEYCGDMRESLEDVREKFRWRMERVAEACNNRQKFDNSKEETKRGQTEEIINPKFGTISVIHPKR